jgi:hypothetical protein
MPFSFELDSALIQGYFGEYKTNEFIEMCFNGLLIHDFGGDIVKDFVGKPDEFQCLEDIRKRLKQRIEEQFSCQI